MKMDCEETQLEEIEVLKSIYEGDDRFKMPSGRSFQYKVGEVDTLKSFVIEFVWGPNYPNEPPVVNLDAFFNTHIVKDVKERIRKQVLDEAMANVGCAMTYTLIEWLKENVEKLLEKQPDQLQVDTVVDEMQQVDLKSQVVPKDKKTQLSKAQKRKIYNVNEKGEKPRGWNWVDIVKHLSQTKNSGEKNAQADDSTS